MTGLADSFDPNANNFVYAVAIQADGKILAGGAFSGANSIGGQTRNYFARLSNDTAALQNIAVTPTTITWTRGGSSPQFTRVTFESSTDNVNYTPLGNGTASGSNWTLTGLNLPIGQNIYIRARGYYRGSFLNASESIQESCGMPLSSLPPHRRRSSPGKSMAERPTTSHCHSRVTPASNAAAVERPMITRLSLPSPAPLLSTTLRVIAGAGTVSSSSGSGTTTVTVNLTGVTNAQRITVTLLAASDGTNTGNVDIPMAVLIGDTTGNGTVSASDVSQTKGQSGQPVTGTNFRTDVNANGSINAGDVSLVKSKTGTALP